MKRCTNDYFVTRTILSIVQDVFNNSPTTRIIWIVCVECLSYEIEGPICFQADDLIVLVKR